MSDAQFPIETLYKSLIAKMGATPIWNLVIATSQSLTLTVNRPIEVHCIHFSDVTIAIAIAHCEQAFTQLKPLRFNLLRHQVKQMQTVGGVSVYGGGVI